MKDFGDKIYISHGMVWRTVIHHSGSEFVAEAEDENYWVQARISEKNGKRMAVVYFGERIEGKQEKNDYTQIFLDFEDEQLRFDKTNKNPMKLLAKLTAEFPSSTTALKKNKK